MESGLRLPSSKKGGWRNYFITVLGCGMLLVGLYIAFTALAPQLYMKQALSEWNEPVVHAKKLTADRLYIPSIKLNIVYKSGGDDVLNDYAWHRFPERGDPKKGGNFIIAGHRFQLGFTPGETRRKSPFYNVNLLQSGQSIYVDFKGVRYRYEITQHFEVKATQVSIEAPTEDDRLTLYSCDLYNPKEIREVIEAKLVEKNVDPEKKF